MNEQLRITGHGGITVKALGSEGDPKNAIDNQRRDLIKGLHRAGRGHASKCLICGFRKVGDEFSPRARQDLKVFVCFECVARSTYPYPE